MEILHTVEFYSPSVGGAQEVVKQLSERLVKRGHSVTIATTKLSERTDRVINGVTIKEFEISGNPIHGYSGEIEQYQKLVRESKFDIVMNYAAQQWTTDLVFPVIHEISAKKVLVPCGFSGLYIPEYSEYFKRMKNILPQYDACIFLSNDYRDINFTKEINNVRREIIPNGAGEDEFRQKNTMNIRAKLNIPEDNFLILHVGSHTGIKGHKEAIQIFTKAKIKNATLLIIGNEVKGGCFNACKRSEKLYRWNPFSKISDKRIIIASLSREETVAAYFEADLFLFPSNIECSPIVLFECMASKTPFLSTDVGNAKEINVWSNGCGALLPTKCNTNGYCKAEIKGSVALLEEMYSHPENLKIRGRRGYEAWGKNFTWEKIVQRYENLYQQLLEN